MRRVRSRLGRRHAPGRDDSQLVAWLDREVNPARTASRTLETIGFPGRVKRRQIC